jgi:F0F1-type ATP synthase assembly protein I
MSSYGKGATRWTGTRKTAAEGRSRGLDVGWTVSGYLISGMAAYGIIGWLVGRAVHVELLFPIGMLVGLAISIGFIIYRYGTQAIVEKPPRKPGGAGSPEGPEGDDR